jgi:hypothetical protein
MRVVMHKLLDYATLCIHTLLHTVLHILLNYCCHDKLPGDREHPPGSTTPCAATVIDIIQKILMLLNI